MSGSWLARGIGDGMLMHYGTLRTEDLARLQEELAVDRAKRVAEINQELADKERIARADAIDKGTEGIIGQKLAGRYASSDAAVADAAAGRTDAPLTQEQLDVIQQSKDGARADMPMREKLEARIEAGSKAGYDMSRDQALLSHLSQQETLSEDRKAKRESDKEYRDALIEDKKNRTDIWARKVANAGSGKDDHYDDKAERRAIEQHDKWLAASFKVDDPANPGKKEVDSETVEKLQLIRDRYSERIGANAAIALTKEFSAKTGRDNLRKLSLDQLTALADRFVVEQAKGKPAAKTDAPAVADAPAIQPEKAVKQDDIVPKVNDQIAQNDGIKSIELAASKTLFGRNKYVITKSDGSREVVDGDKYDILYRTSR